MRIIFKEGHPKSISCCLKFIEEDLRSPTAEPKKNSQKYLFYWKLLDNLYQTCADGSSPQTGFMTKICIVAELLKDEELTQRDDSIEFFNDLLRRFYLVLAD
jgi:hypothetical protein